MSSNELAISVVNLSKRYEIYETRRDRLKQFVMPTLRRKLGIMPRQYLLSSKMKCNTNLEVMCCDENKIQTS